MSVVAVILGISTNSWLTKQRKQKMENITIGSQFTTQKSGVSGTVQEIVENKNGTFRVRLDVNGEPRWTTVK
jgi:preprotein translocase subunit YajC